MGVSTSCSAVSRRFSCSLRIGRMHRDARLLLRASLMIGSMLSAIAMTRRAACAATCTGARPPHASATARTGSRRSCTRGAAMPRALERPMPLALGRRRCLAARSLPPAALAKSAGAGVGTHSRASATSVQAPPPPALSPRAPRFPPRPLPGALPPQRPLARTERTDRHRGAGARLLACVCVCGGAPSGAHSCARHALPLPRLLPPSSTAARRSAPAG